MMRLALATLAVLATCGSLAFAMVQGSSPKRSWSLSLSPAPGDLVLVGIGFRGSGSDTVSGRSLKVAVKGAFGDDYLAVAAVGLKTPAAPKALLLLVNRPSALLDPVGVRLQITTPGSLGAPRVWRVTDPLTRLVRGTKPPLCALSLHGAALTAAALRPLGSRGAALTGFGMTGAVAQAYDVVCRLPYASSFKAAVAGRCPTTSATLCCPENAICASPPAPPTPAPTPPPAPAPHRCPPCYPRPGYACPQVLSPSVCAAPAPAGARRAGASAY